MILSMRMILMTRRIRFKLLLLVFLMSSCPDRHSCPLQIRTSRDLLESQRFRCKTNRQFHSGKVRLEHDISVAALSL